MDERGSGRVPDGDLANSGPRSVEPTDYRRTRAHRQAAPGPTSGLIPGRARLLAVIILVVVAIVLVVVGLTTSSSSGNQKIKGPVPYSLLPTTAPSGTLPASATTSVSTTTSTAASSSSEASPSTEATLSESAASSSPLTSPVGLGQGSSAEGTALPSTLPADAVAVHVPILMYHYVDAFPPDVGQYASGLTVRTPDFEAEMGYLAGNGYHVVSFGEVYQAMAGLAQLPAKPVLLTFDDGGLDNYSVAFPILKRYGFTATFFVITGHVGRSGSMDWDDLREMAGAGMFIGSHTVTHAKLTGVTDTALASELVDSRAAIDREIGETDYVLSYPNGAYDPRVIEAARTAGYLMAVGTNSGTTGDPKAVFEMARRRVSAYMSPQSFAKLLQ